MKKILLCIVLLAIVQNWGRITGFFNPEPTTAVPGTEIVLFSTDWCGYCAQARALFESVGVPYREYDIEKSAEGFKQYQALGGRGVPLLIINGTLLQGFNKRQILRALQSGSTGAT